MKKIIVVVFLFIFLLIKANSSFACVCPFTGPSVSLKRDDAVFIGKVTKVITAKRKWQIKVSTVLKGDVPKTIIFYAKLVGTSCELSNFKLNEKYLFFANKIEISEFTHYGGGKIPTEEQEKIGNYEPQVCSWTDTLERWRSENKRIEVKEDFKDEKFLQLLEKVIKPKN